MYVPPRHCRAKSRGSDLATNRIGTVVRKISLEVRNRLSIYSSRSLVGLHFLEGFPDFPFADVERLCFVHELLPLPDGFSWPVVSAEQRSPFAPAPLQDLHHYYGLLRPCAPHRYSRPRGFGRLRLLSLHRSNRFSRSVQEPG